jgi:glycosyltransferase involved in cell wall biosynthesis
MSKTAFIMSVYSGDRPQWLREALESMLNQSCDGTDLRIYLCVDGPVPHELEECLSEYADRIYKLIRNESNRRLAFSLNRLIESLEDEAYVLRMDADDLCVPERVALQVAFMDANPEILVSGGSIQEFLESPDNKGLLRTYPQTTDEMMRYIVKACPFAHPTVCFRRSFFERVGLYNPLLPAQQDIELWFRAVQKAVPMANIPDTLLMFRTHGGFGSRRNAKVGLRELKIYSCGIYRLYGIHPYLLWPILRLMVRLFPSRLTQLIYRLNLRKLLNR